MLDLISSNQSTLDDDEDTDPSVLVKAPTTNTAFIIGGKTSHYTLGFFSTEKNRYIQPYSKCMVMMKFQYKDDVKAIFCDDISILIRIFSVKIVKFKLT